nr:MAG TPA: hypothetical protein [Caudoviricetes sp.]
MRKNKRWTPAKMFTTAKLIRLSILYLTQTAKSTGK